MKLKTLMINSAGFLNSKLRFYANLLLPLMQGHELKLPTAAQTIHGDWLPLMQGHELKPASAGERGSASAAAPHAGA